MSLLFNNNISLSYKLAHMWKLDASTQNYLWSFLGILASVINWYEFFTCLTDLKNLYLHNIAPIPTKVRNRAKIRNRYNQAPHLTQDTNGKVTTSQLDIISESPGVNPFPAGDHKASTNKREQKHRNYIYEPQKKHRLGTVSKNILLVGLTGFTARQPHP